jgi:hypothetical protein
LPLLNTGTIAVYFHNNNNNIGMCLVSITTIPVSESDEKINKNITV